MHHLLTRVYDLTPAATLRCASAEYISASSPHGRDVDRARLPYLTCHTCQIPVLEDLLGLVRTSANPLTGDRFLFFFSELLEGSPHPSQLMFHICTNIASHAYKFSPFKKNWIGFFETKREPHGDSSDLFSRTTTTAHTTSSTESNCYCEPLLVVFVAGCPW